MRSYILRFRHFRLQNFNAAHLVTFLLLFMLLIDDQTYEKSEGDDALNFALRHQSNALSLASFASVTAKLAKTNHPPTLLNPHYIANSRRIWARNFRDTKLPSDDDWEAVADDVAIVVKTGREVAHKRLEALRKTGWYSVGRRVPNLIVVADVPIPELGVIDIKRYAADVMVGSRRSFLPQANVSSTTIPKKWFTSSGWRGDKDKNLPALHLLKTTFPNAKWYILLDDDTYLFLDNFARYTQLSSPATPVYTGKVFFISNCGEFAHNGRSHFGAGTHEVFAHGGAGIFINSVAMNTMFPNIQKCIHKYSSCWAGDMQVGLCMHDAGVEVHNFKRGISHEYMFTPFWPSRAMADSRYTTRLRSKSEPVTFHKVPPEEGQLISRFEHMMASNHKRVQYNNLREWLMDNAVQPTFGRTKTRYDTRVFVTEHIPHEHED